MTRLQLHLLHWSNCQNCDYHQYRQNIVLVRGTVPAPVVVIGESPNRSEDRIGQPFLGQPGRLLDNILQQSLPPGTPVALTYLVACLPIRSNGSDLTITKPSWKSIQTCSSRLKELIDLCRPEFVISVGSTTIRYLTGKTQNIWKYQKRLDLQEIPIVSIHNPISILKNPLIQQQLLIRQCVIRIRQSWNNRKQFFCEK